MGWSFYEHNISNQRCDDVLFPKDDRVRASFIHLLGGLRETEHVCSVSTNVSSVAPLKAASPDVRSNLSSEPARTTHHLLHIVYHYSLGLVTKCVFHRLVSNGLLQETLLLVFYIWVCENRKSGDI